MGIAIAAPDKLLMSCLNLLRLPNVCDNLLPLQTSGVFDLSDIPAFSFEKLGGVTTTLDGNEYGALMRLQNRANREIMTRLELCLQQNNIRIGSITHNAMQAAAPKINITPPIPSGTITKGIRIARRHNCSTTSGSSGTERLRVAEIRIYPALSYSNVNLYVETNGIIATVVLPQLIGGIENVFSTTQSNPLFKLDAPFVSEGGEMFFTLDAGVIARSARPVCPTCPGSPQCFKAYGIHSTAVGTYSNDVEAYGVVPYVSCYCDPAALICAISHTAQFQNYWLAMLSLVIHEDAQISDVLSNYTVYSQSPASLAAYEILTQKRDDAEAVLCGVLKRLVQNNQDRCLICDGSSISTMI